MKTLSDKTAQTTFWTGIERFLNIGTVLLMQLVLARLLTPSDFGIVAMIAVFIGIAQSVSECGFINALIRKLDCQERDYNTAFYVNLFISILLYIILYILSPLISDFYEMPIINPLLRVYSLLFILESLRIVPYCKLCKELNFKSIARISSLSVLLSGCVGVVMAYCNWGAWALVGQTLSAAFFYLLFLQIKEKWFPRLSFDREAFAYLWGFGSKMLLTGIISRIYSNIYSLLIGKLYTPAILGFFNNGQKYAQFFPNFVESVFVKNSLPILSDFQNDNKRLIDIYRKYIQLVCFITFPVCFIVFVYARQIVILLLTEKWLDSVIYLQIFAITSILIPANSINLNVFQVKGRTDVTLKAEIIKKTMGFIIVALLVKHGPLCLAFGSSMMALFAYIVNVYYTKKVIGISLKVQIADLMPILALSLITCIPAYFINVFIESNILSLFVGGICCFATYVILSYALRLNIFIQLLTYVKNKI